MSLKFGTSEVPNFWTSVSVSKKFVKYLLVSQMFRIFVEETEWQRITIKISNNLKL